MPTLTVRAIYRELGCLCELVILFWAYHGGVRRLIAATTHLFSGLHCSLATLLAPLELPLLSIEALRLLFTCTSKKMPPKRQKRLAPEATETGGEGTQSVRRCE